MRAPVWFARAVMALIGLGVCLLILLIVALPILTSMGEDIADRFVTPEALPSLTFVEGNHQFATCFLAIYSTPTSEPPQLQAGSDGWSADPLETRLSENDPGMDYTIRHVRECWRRDVADVLGGLDFPEYISTVKPLLTRESAEHFAMFDPQRRLFIAISP